MVCRGGRAALDGAWRGKRAVLAEDRRRRSRSGVAAGEAPRRTGDRDLAGARVFQISPPPSSRELLRRCEVRHGVHGGHVDAQHLRAFHDLNPHPAPRPLFEHPMHRGELRTPPFHRRVARVVDEIGLLDEVENLGRGATPD